LEYWSAKKLYSRLSNDVFTSVIWKSGSSWLKKQNSTKFSSFFAVDKSVPFRGNIETLSSKVNCIGISQSWSLKGAVAISLFFAALDQPRPTETYL